jgi:putative SOS response-associated peptidase YedK
MCSAGASAKKVSEDYKAILAIESLDELLPARFHFSAYSFPKVYTIKQEKSNAISYSHWGLIPSFISNWQKAQEFKTQTINAKSETIFEKISFKDSIYDKRCIICMDGFFEYQHIGKEKTPYYIFPKEQEQFLMGGIYNDWVNTETGEVYSTASIITTEANELMSEIHNKKKRMPLLFDAEDAKNWLQKDLNKNDITDLMKIYGTEKMNAHKINKELLSIKKLDEKNENIIKPFINNTPKQQSLF